MGTEQVQAAALKAEGSWGSGHLVSLRITVLGTGTRSWADPTPLSSCGAVIRAGSPTDRGTVVPPPPRPLASFCAPCLQVLGSPVRSLRCVSPQPTATEGWPLPRGHPPWPLAVSSDQALALSPLPGGSEGADTTCRCGSSAPAS